MTISVLLRTAAAQQTSWSRVLGFRVLDPESGDSFCLVFPEDWFEIGRCWPQRGTISLPDIVWGS